jgi:hypothetical protein
MKKLLLSIAICGLMNFIYAQQIPEFQTTIYVQDLQGNIDSVVVGYDSLATTWPGYDSLFDESNISTLPWKKFEVRTAQLSGMPGQDTYSKKQIGEYWCNSDIPWLNGFMFYLVINPDSTPVYIRWNSSDFQAECRDSSTITDFNTYFTYPGIPGQIYTRMAIGNTYTPGFNVNKLGGIEVNSSNGGKDTVYTVAVGIFDFLFISNTNEQKQIQQQTRVFPNPTTEAFTIALPENYYSESVKVFDITGRVIYESTEKSNQINVPSANWAKGIYFYQVLLEDGILVSGKVLRD